MLKKVSPKRGPTRPAAVVAPETPIPTRSFRSTAQTRKPDNLTAEIPSTPIGLEKKSNPNASQSSASWKPPLFHNLTMITTCLRPPPWKIPAIAVPSTSSSSSRSFLQSPQSRRFLQPQPKEPSAGIASGRRRGGGKGIVRNWLFPVDPWAPTIDSESIAPQLFALSLFPYLGFLYFITKSKTAPKLTLFGFYFLLAFVGATIPAGIYAKVQYGTSLSNVDWLHGGAESLLTLTNLFIVLGLRGALRRVRDTEQSTSVATSKAVHEEKSSV